MFRFLSSLFGSSVKKGSYPESLVKMAIERAVDGTDPWLRAVSGYKKKLRPAVIAAIDHVVTLVDSFGPPIVIAPDSYDSDPLLRTFFISSDDMRKIIAADRNLAEFLKGEGGTADRVFTLLATEKQENVFFGAVISGDIIIKDVPQTSVSFEAHRLIDPSASEETTRRQLKRRAFDHLLSLALRQIADVKAERGTLERYRTLLQTKLAILERGGMGFKEADPNEQMDPAGMEELLAKIESQLLELGGDDKMLELYLGILVDVLSRPGEQLWGRKETMILDRMGIKRSEPDFNAPEVTLDMLYNAEGRSLVVSLVELPRMTQQ